MRLDAEMVAFFCATGRRYQSDINTDLQDYVLAQKKAGREG